MKTPSLFRLAVILAIVVALFAGRALAAATSALPAVDSSETAAQRDARMKWWREARFGLFIHWGLYAIPAGTWQGKPVAGIGEWIMNRGRIPVADYARFAAEFNPVKFDADAWVRLAREAGMKYIIITSKHHDGFAMFRSAASPFNIYDATPFKRDPLRELADACRKHGMKLGFYYSQAQDWHHRGGAASGGHWDRAAQDGDMDAYLRDIAVPQVKEILTKYGPVAVLWWDTPTDMTRERANLLAPLIALQPGLVTNNRLGGGYQGDTETPENKVPATGYPRDWEACMTMNDTWGFKSYDDNWKSGETLVRTLIDIASKGGNFLLNVGPTAAGEIPAPSVERLQQVGAWMRRNSESIHATTASPFRRLEWGRATRKSSDAAAGRPDKLYLHVFTWPKDGTLVVPMRGTAKKAYLLGAPGAALALKPSPAGLWVTVPALAPDPIASVIVLEGVDPIDPLPPPPIAAGAGARLVLGCDDADLSGKDLRVEGNTQLNLTGWNRLEAYAQWDVRIDQPGTYQVVALYAVPAGQGGSEFSVAVGAVSLAARTDATGGTYKPITLGTVRVERTGPTKVTLRPTAIAGTELMRLRALTLQPVPSP